MPKGITIVGLGPGAPGLLTVEAQQVLQGAPEIHLRTRKHPTVAALPPSVRVYSFDSVYESANTFEDVYAEIAWRIVELGERSGGVVYAVPGHPLVGEASVQHILSLAEDRDLTVRIVEGLSFMEPVCTLLKLDPLDGLQIADATALAMRHYPESNPDLPLLISQLYSRDLAADVKLVLMMVYPEDQPITLIRAASTGEDPLLTMPLYELDRCEKIDHLTSLYVPPFSDAGSLAAFQEIVAHLRAPGGCPWDREQTHRSLRPYLLEETYEVLQALDDEDIASLKEELGDLLLQILLHTQIAIEQHEFKMADVVAHIVAKLKRRHPHVFGQVQVSGTQEVLANWEGIKDEERNHERGKGTLSGVPSALPALSRARVLQSRAARLGFDGPSIGALWAEIEEKWQELRKAAKGENAEAELGALLFSVVDLARQLNIDAECALRQAGTSFEHRFEDTAGERTVQGGQPSDREGA